MTWTRCSEDAFRCHGLQRRLDVVDLCMSLTCRTLSVYTTAVEVGYPCLLAVMSPPIKREVML